MTIIDRGRRRGSGQASQAPTLPARPAPETPHTAVSHRLESGVGLGQRLDLPNFYAHLGEVAVCSRSDGVHHEVSFVLYSTDGRWQSIGCGEPAAGQLMLYLGQLPGFDVALMRELITRPCLTQPFTMLWRRGQWRG